MISIWLLYIVIGTTTCQKHKPLNFPLQGDITLEDRDKPVFEFDGIDYESLPTKYLKDMYTDCEAQLLRCVRHQVTLTPICVLEWIGGFFYNFDQYHYTNVCELQRQNCYVLIDKKMDKYGEDLYSGIAFYQGEGGQCQYVRRRLVR